MDPEANANRSSELQQETTQAGVSFLLTEVDASLTFAETAIQAADDSDRRRRNRAHARKGYDTLLRFKDRWLAAASDHDIQYFEEKLLELEDNLHRLGEVL